MAAPRLASAAAPSARAFRLALGMQPRASGPVHVCSLQYVAGQVRAWTELAPGLVPHYAIKCNNDDEVIRTVVQAGGAFDCASAPEMAQAFAAGADAAQIVFSHPVKREACLEYARNHGVNLTVFDSVAELDKIAAVHPGTQLLLRVSTDDKEARIRFSAKFGAAPDAVPELLRAAKLRGLEVVGASFHVGSANLDEAAYKDAVARVAAVFTAATELGFRRMHVVDIGGGWPAVTTDADHERFQRLARATVSAVDELLPADAVAAHTGLQRRVLAEPGRHLVAGADAMLATVVGRRDGWERGLPEAGPAYFVNDGLYGSFNCVVYDQAAVAPLPLPRAVLGSEHGVDADAAADAWLAHARSVGRGLEAPPATWAESSVWGQTCDGLDVVHKAVRLPLLAVGDHMLWDAMGAYTSAAASAFNGFQPATKVYIPASGDVDALYAVRGEPLQATMQEAMVLAAAAAAAAGEHALLGER